MDCLKQKMNIIRSANTNDSIKINLVMNEWWGKAYEDFSFSKAFISHFSETCLISESSNEMNGFLIGFKSQTYENTAYIKFVLVNPICRNQRIGHNLYEKFFEISEKMKCNVIESVTSLNNKGSIRFHLDLGFQIVEQEHKIEGYYVCKNYHGRPNTDRIVFRKGLQKS